MSQDTSQNETTEKINIEYWKDRERIGTVQPLVEEAQYEEFVEFADTYFHSKSAAARHLIALGMRSFVQNDPRNMPETPDQQDSSAVTIRELIPEGEENAVDIRDELLEKIDDQLLEIVNSDPEITLDGWEVYR